MGHSFSHLTFQSIIEGHPDSPAIISANEQISWEELAARMSDKRSGLQKHGLKGGDKCAIYAPASAKYIETLIAMWSMGVVAVPLNTRMPVGQIDAFLRSIQCEHLITESTIGTGALTRPLSFQSIEDQTGKKSTDVQLGLERDATIIFTSGSTGVGKACLHTFGNHFYSALGSNQNIRIEPGDAWLLCLPLYHVSGIGILFRCLLSGGSIMIPPTGVALTDILRRMEPTHLSLVATQLQQLIADEAVVNRLKSLKAILLGGSAMPAKLIQKAFELELPIHTSYGSTEMSSQIAATPPGASLEQLKTSGVTLKYREIMIAPDAEIWVRGKTLFKGLVDGTTVQSATDGDGWYHTRDIGWIDADGYITIMGRRDNMFISGGENIYPEEIEKALEKLDGVVGALVVPVDDEKFGQRPVAFVRAQEGYAFNTIKFDDLRTSLPGYKMPLRLFAWDEEIDAKPNRTRFRHLARKLFKS